MLFSTLVMFGTQKVLKKENNNNNNNNNNNKINNFLIIKIKKNFEEKMRDCERIGKDKIIFVQNSFIENSYL